MASPGGGVLKLFLEECTHFTILSFITIVVQGLLSFHHLKKTRKTSLTAFATAAVGKNNHNKPNGNRAYILQKG
jgi:hypothetical protein